MPEGFDLCSNENSKQVGILSKSLLSLRCIAGHKLKHSLALRDTPIARLRSTVKNPQAEIRAFCFNLLIKTFENFY